MVIMMIAQYARPKINDYDNLSNVRINLVKINSIALVDSNIEQMAGDGDKYSCVCLGWMYRHARGVRMSYENYSTAVKWYRKAAEQGHANAQFKLGYMYEDGCGVDRNNSTAVEWYRKAAEQGHADAQYNAGKMYEYGKGVDKNYSTAVEWFRKAAEQGYANANSKLGWMYENGWGVD